MDLNLWKSLKFRSTWLSQALLSLCTVWGLPLELRRPPGRTTLLSGPGHWVPLLTPHHLSILHWFKSLVTVQTTENVFKFVIAFFQHQLSHFDFWTQFEHPDHAQAALPPEQELRPSAQEKENTSESSKYLTTAALQTREISPWPRGLAPNLYLKLAVAVRSESIKLHH